MSIPIYSIETQALQRALAFQYAENFCERNGLSADKLRKQRFQIIKGVGIFAQPTGVMPNGLTNDLATRPIPTLMISLNAGTLQIETTEHTKKYLGE